MTENNIIELFPSVIDSPLFIATKRILAQTQDITQKEKERALLFTLSALEKHDVKLEIVK